MTDTRACGTYCDGCDNWTEFSKLTHYCGQWFCEACLAYYDECDVEIDEEPWTWGEQCK